jgi:hypothetical protein
VIPQRARHGRRTRMSTIERRKLNGGRLKEASYDPKAQQLEIVFVDGSQKTFKAVQPEVWRRLVASPNPASFYTDRIEEEYAFATSRTASGAQSLAELESLFGPGSGSH